MQTQAKQCKPCSSQSHVLMLTTNIVCFDMCEPTLPEEPVAPSPPSQKRPRTASTTTERASPFPLAHSHDGPHVQQTGGKTVLNMACLGCLHHESNHHDHTHPHPQSLNPPTPPVDDALARQPFDDSSPYQANESQGSWSMEQSHPSFVASRKLDMEVCRPFPLQDYNEACLFKYYIDEVAPWVCHSETTSSIPANEIPVRHSRSRSSLPTRGSHHRPLKATPPQRHLCTISSSHHNNDAFCIKETHL